MARTNGANEHASHNGEQLMIEARINSIEPSEPAEQLTIALRTDNGIVKAIVDSNTVAVKTWESAKIVTPESRVRVSGTATNDQNATTINVTSITILAYATPGSKPYTRNPSPASLNNRLDNRTLDLRHAGSGAILKLHSALCQLIVEYLGSQEFHWIHAPRIISHRVSGDREYFDLPYPGGGKDTANGIDIGDGVGTGKAWLAQNPAYQGQMALSMDMGRVFDIGPAFRNEAKSTNSGRHLTEFTVLGTGMVFEEDYHEVVDVMDEMLLFVFRGLQERPHYRRYIETVKKHYPAAREFRIGVDKDGKIPRITFMEAKKLLRDELGMDADDTKDLSEAEEAALGRHFRSSPKHQTDVFTIDQYPIAYRPFNTHPSTSQPSTSPVPLANAWDTIVGGREICSGSQRIHIYEDICAAMANAGMGPEAKEWDHYRDAFRMGTPRHGGVGLGVNRLLQGFLGLDDVREGTLFPRDVNRLAP